MERQGAGGRVEGADTLRVSSEASSATLSDRVRELEAENVRLKSLIGELLVANQLLREVRKEP